MTFTCPDCGATIAGTNCAHSLSRAEGWKDKRGCVYMCPCKYPVRAKGVRSNIFSSYLDGNKKAKTNAYIYCQKGNQGHVYYGTYETCQRGNGYTAKAMGAPTFERYNSAS